MKNFKVFGYYEVEADDRKSAEKKVSKEFHVLTSTEYTPKVKVSEES